MLDVVKLRALMELNCGSHMVLLSMAAVIVNKMQRVLFFQFCWEKIGHVREVQVAIVFPRCRTVCPARGQMDRDSIDSSFTQPAARNIPVFIGIRAGVRLGA